MIDSRAPRCSAAVTFPGLAIMFTVLGINLLSEGVRSVYDPRQRR